MYYSLSKAFVQEALQTHGPYVATWVSHGNKKLNIQDMSLNEANNVFFVFQSKCF